jgi:hypothetical protein
LRRNISLPRIAGMATMPSRAETAPRAIESILPQVHELWLFLDRFEEVPEYARHEKIRVLRSQDVGDLRANGKLLPVALRPEPFTFFATDDDILYPEGFCRTLESRLDRHAERLVVGVHGALLRSPLVSYREALHVLHRRAAQADDLEVDILGTDSLAFRSSTLRFDVRAWEHVNACDPSFALEARRHGVPLLSIRRAAYWMNALAENQADSIWMSVLGDDTRQTELVRELVAMPRPELPPRRRRFRLRTKAA